LHKPQKIKVMHAWLRRWWDYLLASFWFVPALMLIGGLGLALAMVEIDRTYPHVMAGWLGGTVATGERAARTLLSTLVSAIISTLAVVFSVTIVALTMMVGQLGPRLLRNFMEDRGNQLVLGTFVATAGYCVLCLAMIGRAGSRGVPHVATLAALLLALASLSMLIFFVHHVAQSIQSPYVVMLVSRQLDKAIDRLEDRSSVTGDDDGQVQPGETGQLGEQADAGVVEAAQSNYLLVVDYPTLVNIASEREAVMSVRTRPGRFVTSGESLVWVWPARALDDTTVRQIRRMFIFGPERTPTQDLEFAVRQLVEVALRAMSPAMNDPFTAMTCLDRLGAGLCRLAGRVEPRTAHRDRNGTLRVLADRPTFGEVVDVAFDQVRRVADTAVMLRLMHVLARIARQSRTDAHHTAIRRHARMAYGQAMDQMPVSEDRRRAAEAFAAVERAIEANQATIAAAG